MNWKSTGLIKCWSAPASRDSSWSPCLPEPDMTMTFAFEVTGSARMDRVTP